MHQCHHYLAFADVVPKTQNLKQYVGFRKENTKTAHMPVKLPLFPSAACLLEQRFFACSEPPEGIRTMHQKHRTLLLAFLLAENKVKVLGFRVLPHSKVAGNFLVDGTHHLPPECAPNHGYRQ